MSKTVQIYSNQVYKNTHKLMTKTITTKQVTNIAKLLKNKQNVHFLSWLSIFSLCYNERLSIFISLLLGAFKHVPQFASRWKCYFKRVILGMFWVEVDHLSPIRWSLLGHLFPMAWFGKFPWIFCLKVTEKYDNFSDRVLHFQSNVQKIFRSIVWESWLTKLLTVTGF
jgi:hypothetical protein